MNKNELIKAILNHFETIVDNHELYSQLIYIKNDKNIQATIKVIIEGYDKYIDSYIDYINNSKGNVDKFIDVLDFPRTNFLIQLIKDLDDYQIYSKEYYDRIFNKGLKNPDTELEALSDLIFNNSILLEDDREYFDIINKAVDVRFDFNVNAISDLNECIGNNREEFERKLKEVTGRLENEYQSHKNAMEEDIYNLEIMLIFFVSNYGANYLKVASPELVDVYKINTCV